SNLAGDHGEGSTRELKAGVLNPPAVAIVATGQTGDHERRDLVGLPARRLRYVREGPPLVEWAALKQVSDRVSADQPTQAVDRYRGLPVAGDEPRHFEWKPGDFEQIGDKQGEVANRERPVVQRLGR